MDRDQLVGYDMKKKLLVVTVSDHMAQKLLADGWNVGQDKGTGFFVTIALVEEEGT
jgi:uncharacterized protein GlcG (DUF336 family)